MQTINGATEEATGNPPISCSCRKTHQFSRLLFCGKPPQSAEQGWICEGFLCDIIDGPHCISSAFMEKIVFSNKHFLFFICQAQNQLYHQLFWQIWLDLLMTNCHQFLVLQKQLNQGYQKQLGYPIKHACGHGIYYYENLKKLKQPSPEGKKGLNQIFVRLFHNSLKFINFECKTRDGNSSESFIPRGIEESRNGKFTFLGDRGI